MEQESFINVNVDDAVELKSLAAGTEVQLRIVDAESKTSSNTGNDYLNVRLDIPTEPYSKDIFHIMMLPTQHDDAKKANNRKLAIKRFCEAFGLSTGQMNLKEWPGHMAWAILGEEDDPEYGKRNRIKRFVNPR
jgi:hypothetical protein